MGTHKGVQELFVLASTAYPSIANPELYVIGAEETLQSTSEMVPWMMIPL